MRPRRAGSLTTPSFGLGISLVVSLLVSARSKSNVEKNVKQRPQPAAMLLRFLSLKVTLRKKL
jgi:hypothetical protein